MPFRDKVLLVLILLFQLNNLTSQPIDMQWSVQADGYWIDHPNSFTHDNDGNLIVTGSFWDSVYFSSTLLVADRVDIYIAKYDQNGNLIWVKQAGGSQDDMGSAVVTDCEDNIYVTGSFSSIAFFDNDTLTSNGNRDLFIAKFDPNGSVIWVKHAGSYVPASYERGHAMTFDSHQKLCIVGIAEQNAIFESDTVFKNSPSSWNNFVAKYDTNGNLIWVREAGIHIGAFSSAINYSISTDSFDNVFIAGEINKQVIDTLLPGIYNYPELLISKFNTAGDSIWEKRIGNFGHTASGNGIICDLQGNLYVTGHFSGDMDFGNYAVIPHSYGRSEFFIVKYSNDGVLEWVKQAPNAAGFSLDKDINDNVYCAGLVYDLSVFGTDTLRVDSSGAEIFIIKYDNLGFQNWIFQTINNSTGSLYAVINDNCNRIYLAGTFRDSLTIGDTTLYGDRSIFLTRLNELTVQECQDECNSSVGINAIEPINRQLVIYPNPTTDFVELRVDRFLTESWELEIINLNGQVLLTKNFQNLTRSMIRIDVSSLMSGAYFIKVSDSNTQVIEKLIVYK